jgi:hypothetical protein
MATNDIDSATAVEIAELALDVGAILVGLTMLTVLLVGGV